MTTSVDARDLPPFYLRTSIHQWTLMLRGRVYYTHLSACIDTIYFLGTRYSSAKEYLIACGLKPEAVNLILAHRYPQEHSLSRDLQRERAGQPVVHSLEPRIQRANFGGHWTYYGYDGNQTTTAPPVANTPEGF